MTWEGLSALGASVLPLSGVRPAPGHQRARFSAPLAVTLAGLSRELRALDAERVVVELDIREQDIRRDGYPRAHALRPASPPVAVSFASKHGPLRYATCEFDDWTDNLRAVVLSMEALRAVDRYGVSKRGEQYAGWKALPRSTDPADAIETVDQAWRVICRFAGVPVDSSPLLNGISQDGAIRAALRATHPDHGGNADDFRVARRAQEILSAE